MEKEKSIKSIINGNPSAILDSIAEPSPLTISQMAILEKIDSPLLSRNVTNLVENIKATYIVNIPYKDAVAQIKDETFESRSMEWADSLGWDVFQEKLGLLLVGLFGFWKMMPPPESDSDSKKKMEETVEK